MTHRQAIYRLVLHPAAAVQIPANFNKLPQQLQNLGLLGESLLLHGEHCYRLGERFYQWLTFMGCAPALKLEPDGPGDEKFCHFRFCESTHAEFRYLRPEVKGRCPHCRKPGTTAGKIYREYFLQHRDWSCPYCQRTLSPEDICWKHEAGISRMSIDLVDVHPHEVVPTDSLLNELASLTDRNWRYFYAVA